MKETKEMNEMLGIKKRTEEIFKDVLRIRRYLHANPELSGEERETSLFIQSELAKLGIEYTAGIAGYGVTGTVYGRNKDRGVGIRADMDALPVLEETNLPFKSQKPGVMHACGHDIHVAILLGTAKILSEMKDELPACVRLIFQPSEETTGGAMQMIEEGCLSDPPTHSVIGLHVDPALPAGSVKITPGIMNAASCEFQMKVTGKGCHGAYPWTGIDPLLPSCLMVTGLQSIVAKKLPLGQDGLISVGKFHSGKKNNIISDETMFSGIIRTFDKNACELIKKEIQSLCSSTAAAYGAACEIRFHDSYPVLKNDPQLQETVYKAISDILGEDRVVISPLPSFGTDDFSYFCHGSRGFYYNLGVKGPLDTTCHPLHSPLFCADEKAIITGIMTEVASVIKIMKDLC